MRPLVPEIIVGKPYKWNGKPIEFPCPGCGRTDSELALQVGEAVTVMYSAQGKIWACGDCGYCWPVSEGWWAVKGKSDRDIVVPYTQLSRIEGEVYE